MKLYTLNNGINIPAIGYGTFPQKESLNENIAVAVRSGYQLIDTSDNYYNEEYVGNGLKKVEKGSLTVISKCSDPYRFLNVEDCFEESKEVLDDKLDIYLLHWPYPFLWRKMWKQMESIYLQKKCRAIGVCNFEKKHLKRLLRICRVVPMIDQFECHPDFQQKETLEFCKDHGIQVMSYSPLARNDPSLMRNSVLERIAKEHDKTVSQIILAWNVSKGLLPIPSSVSEEHMRSNIDIFEINLSADEIAAIDGLEANNRVRFDPDKRFSLKEKISFFAFWILKR